MQSESPRQLFPKSCTTVTTISPSESTELGRQKSASLWTSIACLCIQLLQLAVCVFGNRTDATIFETVGHALVAMLFAAVIVQYFVNGSHVMMRYSLFLLGLWSVLSFWLTHECDMLVVGPGTFIGVLIIIPLLFFMGGTWVEGVVYATISSVLVGTLLLLQTVQRQNASDHWCPFAPSKDHSHGIQTCLGLVGAQVVELVTIRMFVTRLRAYEQAHRDSLNLLKQLVDAMSHSESKLMDNLVTNCQRDPNNQVQLVWLCMPSDRCLHAVPAGAATGHLEGFFF